ncbi:unnamed protein product [Brassica rapa]|uniref:Uncharacterized protein n=1 Tax=Brassica campestris TaxID=3711 RepID=A0A8D9HTQ3_BRACM|nr:unnamed protein product [Brassica rapa]
MALPAAVVYSDLWVCSGLGTFPFCRLRFRGSHLLFCSMLCGLSRVCLCFKRRKETFALLVSASPTPLLRVIYCVEWPVLAVNLPPTPSESARHWPGVVFWVWIMTFCA